MDKSSLGDRMKFYESWGSSSKNLAKGLPTIIRIDGKKFSSWTKNLEKPFHSNLNKVFRRTSYRMMKEHFGEVVLAYGQSDEVSFLLRPTSYVSDGQFGNKREKLVSLSASMFTAIFNEEKNKYIDLSKKELAFFDSRVFQVPSLIEAYNVILWRQQDAIRNSISMLAQTHFSHNKLHGKSQNNMLKMLSEINIEWNDLPIFLQRGWTILRRKKEILPEDLVGMPEVFRPKEPIMRRIIEEDLNMPELIFNKDYILNLIKEKDEV